MGHYYYSLADYMWKKGILTDEVGEKAAAMINSGFGLDIWEKAGEKTLLNFGEAVHAAADELIEAFHQSAVLIQANPTNTEFYGD